MTQTLTFRRAAPDDVPALARLREASDWEGGAGEQRMSRYLLGEHNPQHARPPRVAILAESSKGVVGFIAGHLTERFGCEGELQWILVAPAYRGGAAAPGLLRELAAWFVSHGAERVCVNVDSANAQARRFYARHGAVSLSEHWMMWIDIAAPQVSADSVQRPDV